MARKSQSWDDLPATPRQIECLTRLGVEVPPDCTKARAGELIDVRVPPSAFDRAALLDEGLDPDQFRTARAARDALALIAEDPKATRLYRKLDDERDAEPMQQPAHNDSPWPQRVAMTVVALVITVVALVIAAYWFG